MKKTILLSAILAINILFGGCDKDDTPSPSTTAELRILNATTGTFFDCTIDPTGTLSDNPGPNAHNYGEVKAGTLSSYHTFEKIYRYAWVRLTMNNKFLYIRFYDYTGEKALKSGKYTYKLTQNATTGQLSYEMSED